MERLTEQFARTTRLIRMHRRQIMLGGGVVLLVVIVLQLAYPRSRALPFSKIDGQHVGLLNQAELESYLSWRYDATPVAVKTGGATTEVKLAETGLYPDAARTQQVISRYPLWQQLIPFSMLVKPLTQNARPPLATDSKKFDAFVQKITVACTLSPQNAQLSIKNSEVVLDPSKQGRSCKTDDIKHSLQSSSLASRMTVNVPTQTIEPERTDASLQTLVTQAQAITHRQIQFTIGGKSLPMSQELLASWIKFNEDPATKAISLSLDGDKITQYLSDKEQLIYVAPEFTTITIENGIEISRTEGKPGLGLNKTATAKTINSVLLGDGSETVITASLMSLPAKVRYNRSYINDAAGLNQLLADLAAEKGNFAVSVYELSGQGRIASANGDRRYITASIYKLFIAYSVLKRVDSGQMVWSQQITSNRNLDQCFEAMIVVSDNECPVALGKLIGWKTVQAEVQALGLSNTFLQQAPTYDNYSTVSDVALLLAKLQRGELVSAASRDRWISAMSRQVYRKGIPKGTTASVADKVGFLYGLLHDAGIVYSPHGAYVMVVMSDGGSWADIADATSRVDALLAQ